MWGVGEMKKGLLLLGVLLLMFIGLRWNSAPFLSVQKYHCLQTGILSQDYFSSITTCVGNLLRDKFCARAIIDHVKKEFPAVSKVMVTYRPSAVQVKIYAHNPVCCVNNSLVLTSNNELFAKDTFSKRALCTIPDIVVAQESMAKSTSILASLLQELPSDFNQNYDLEFVNEHCVYLVDKQEPCFTIISSMDQKKTSQLLAHCESVKKNIKERKGFDKTFKWAADTRFAEYIIVYRV